MGYRQELPSFPPANICKFYRKALREVRSIPIGEISDKVMADRVGKLPRLVEATMPTLEQKKQLSADTSKMAPGISEPAVFDQSWKATKDWSSRTIRRMVTEAVKKETRLLERWSLNKDSLTYPEMPQTMVLPRIDDKPVKWEEFVDALNREREESEDVDDECANKGLSRIKYQILHNETDRQIRMEWARLAKSTGNREIYDEIKSQSEIYARKHIRQRKSHRQPVPAEGEPLKENPVESDPIMRTIHWVHEADLLDLIKEAREERQKDQERRSSKRVHSPSPERETKRHSGDKTGSSAEPMETESSTKGEKSKKSK